MDSPCETRADILKAARVTPTQLARWGAYGLIARPRQIGLGRGAGTTTVYPAGTARRVIAVSELLPRHRRLADIAWQLWLGGEVVDDRLVCGYLASAARLHDRVLAIARMLGFARPEITRRALRALGAFSRSRQAPRDIKEQVGTSERFETVMRTSLQVMLGTYDGTAAWVIGEEDDDGVILERAMGIAAARTDRVMDLPPLVKRPLSTDLESIARTIGGGWLPTVEAATTEELDLARERWRDLFRTVTTVGETFAEAYGTNLSGLPQMARILRGFGSPEVALAVIVLLRIERAADPGLRQGFVTVREAGRAFEAKALPAFRALRILREHLPELAEVLSPARMRAAISSKAAFAAYTNEIRTVAERHADEVSAVLRRAGVDVSSVTTAGG